MDHSIVAIDRGQNEIKDGKVYAVNYDEGNVIKKVFRNGNILQLVSENQEEKFQPPLLLDLTDPQYRGRNPVIGRVVWGWREY